MYIFDMMVLVLVTVLTYVWLKRNFDKVYRKKLARRDRLNADVAALAAQGSGLEGERRTLREAYDEKLALFDIAREITLHLDEGTVFNSFVEQLGRHIQFTGCRFVRELSADLAGSRVLEMKMGGTVFGYLAVDGVEEDDSEKFRILGSQFILGIKRAILYRKVQETATFDGLTRAFTRSYWFERSGQELERSGRFGYHASCLMIDIDRFKDINDRYGHLVGDAILAEVSRRVHENIRLIDLFGKYGGEEFCLLLTETDLDNALFVAERIRNAIGQGKIRAYDEELEVTVSVGVSVFPESSRDLAGLIDAADRALYKAKQGGRNRVCS
ncbi:MAG: GGDEF domain-containing protein [Deltaproteobacteria bacterium]